MGTYVWLFIAVVGAKSARKGYHNHPWIEAVAEGWNEEDPGKLNQGT